MASGWLRGVVKEVPSGDTVVIAAGAKPGAIPAEKRITLSSVIAPKLVRSRAMHKRASMRPGGTSPPTAPLDSTRLDLVALRLPAAHS